MSALRYVSTRGRAAPRDFAATLLAGLAEDGGLFVPERWPSWTGGEWRARRGLAYPALAASILAAFAGGAIGEAALARIATDAYRGFDHPAIAPLVQIDRDLFALELFHGPTLAFKDMAMQVLGGLFAHVLERDDRRVTIVGATSGDTGSAAIEACRDRARIELVVLHPDGRTSEVQRRQMTTVHAPNIRNLALDGDFDDCQAMVKALFADASFRREFDLSAVNSINWARIAAQVPYYAHAALMLGAPDREVDFAVPSGNFGNVLAAWVARRMGLPIGRLVIGSNRNDILARFLAGNDMRVAGVVPSLSPSMDIQVSSNFERLLFELLGRDPARTAATMEAFARTGRMAVPHEAWGEATALFAGLAVGDDATLDEIRRSHRETGRLVDPHSAIGIAAARVHARPGVPMVAVATAHAAKFPDAVLRATGARPALPPHLSDLLEREERFAPVPNERRRVEAAIRAHVRRDAA